MKLGLCLHPSDLIGFVSPPCDFIEGHVQDFFLPEQPAFACTSHFEQATQCPIPMPAANCFLPAQLKVTGPEVDLERVLRYAETVFARAKSIGLTTIVFGSAGARMVPEGWSTATGFEQYVQTLVALAPKARECGVTLVVEPLNYGECNLINTIAEGAEAVRRANHPNIMLLADIFHMLRNGESAETIEQEADLIVHAHVAENISRAEPGFSGDDFRPYLRALKKAVKCQRLTLECVWSGDKFKQAGPALAVLRKQMEEAS